MKPETAKALIEMVRAAAKQFAGYDGPIVITLCRSKRRDRAAGLGGRGHLLHIPLCQKNILDPVDAKSNEQL